MFMGDANRTALAELCEHFQQHYAALSHMCMQDGIVQYPFPIKMHYFWHLCCENGGSTPERAGRTALKTTWGGLSSAQRIAWLAHRPPV